MGARGALAPRAYPSRSGLGPRRDGLGRRVAIARDLRGDEMPLGITVSFVAIVLAYPFVIPWPHLLV